MSTKRLTSGRGEIVLSQNGRVFISKLEASRRATASALLGILGYRGPRRSLADMEAAIGSRRVFRPKGRS